MALVASHFRNNTLSSLPAEIGVLSHLGTFDLHSNQVAIIIYLSLVEIW
jgi:Leucine-rich repeat (LRR) protein